MPRGDSRPTSACIDVRGPQRIPRTERIGRDRHGRERGARTSEATQASIQEEAAAPPEQYSEYDFSQCPDEVVDSEGEEDELIEALSDHRVGEGRTPPAKQGSLRLGKHLDRSKLDLFDCLCLDTIKTTVNWRQNGQSSQRDYFILAVRTRPSKSRLSFLTLR